MALNEPTTSMPVLTYKDVIRGPMLQELGRKKFKYFQDVFNPNADIPDDAIVLDEIDIILIDTWAKYIHGAEALLWQFCCNTVDEPHIVRDVFQEYIIEPSSDRFHHLFHVDKESVKYMETLSNLDKGKDLAYTLNTTYVFQFADNLRKKYSNEPYTKPNELDYTTFLHAPLVKDTKIESRRPLSTDLCLKPTAQLARLVDESKKTIKVFMDIKALTKKAKYKSGDSDFFSSMSEDLSKLGNKVQGFMASKGDNHRTLKNDSTILMSRNHRLTGYYPIDGVIGGMGNNDINLLVSQQGYGKSQELIQIGLEMVAKKQDKVLFFSPELPFSQVEQRIWSFCFKGFDFMAHNEGAYSSASLEAMKVLIGMSPTYKAIAEKFVVVDYEDIGCSPENPSKPFEFGEKILNQISEMQKKHNFDCLFMDSLYKYVPEALYQSRYVSMIKSKFCNTFNRPVWLSTQLNPNEGKHYLDESVTHINMKKIAGGARMTDDVSSCYAVFNGYNVEQKNYFKKLIYIKKRLSVSATTCEHMPLDRRESTYSISPDETNPPSDIHKKSVSDIIYQEFVDAGFADLYNEVRRSLYSDKTQHDKNNQNSALRKLDVSDDPVGRIKALLSGGESQKPVALSAHEDCLSSTWNNQEMHPWKKRVYSKIHERVKESEFEDITPLTEEELYFFNNTGREHYFDGTLWSSSPPAGVLLHLVTKDEILLRATAIKIYREIQLKKKLKRDSEEAQAKSPYFNPALRQPVEDPAPTIVPPTPPDPPVIEEEKVKEEDKILIDVTFDGEPKFEYQIQQPESKKEDEGLPARLESVLPEG